MRKDIPKRFLNEYIARSKELQKALEQIISFLKLRLAHLAAIKGIRAKITEGRVKLPVKIWKNAGKSYSNPAEVLTRVEDLLGVRIVCNNLSDIDPIVEMLRTDCNILLIKGIKEMIRSSTDGYRAIHIRTEFIDNFKKDQSQIPCEIQIRTLSQDTWAHLSRADLYAKNAPSSIRKLARALSTQLSTIDEIAQLIRDELNRCPSVAEKIKDTDHIIPPRLALLYQNKFGEEIYKWSFVDWVEHLKEAEAETIGDVRRLLDDTALRDSLNEISNRIRGFSIQNSEWAVYSALVASEANINLGVKAVRKRIQSEWDEIVATARNEILLEMPDKLEEFAEMLEDGHIPVDALKELGGIKGCFRCGRSILLPEEAATAVLDYYGNPDSELDIWELFAHLNYENDPELEESVDWSGACQYCGYQMSKDG